MAQNIEYLNSQEAAKILGVNVSTIKRWTEESKLECIKSAGGHRKFTFKQLASFLNENRRKTSKANLFPIENETDLQLSSHILKGNFPYLIDFLEKNALEANQFRINKVLTGLYLAQYPLHIIYDRIITPVLHRVGQLWLKNELTIIEEHIVTQILKDGILRLQGIVRLPEKPKMGKVLCTTFSSELHDIALKMIQHILEFRGFKVYNTGQITPLMDIEEVIDTIRPVRVYLSSAYLDDKIMIQNEFNHVCSICEERDIALYIGGNGFDHLEINQHAVVQRLFTFEDVFHI
ncbi:MAG: MerR family transcriptional regulator [Caldithrix sp.]|nr:MerR family transcriptional regulator [Caldithrix sp.]